MEEEMQRGTKGPPALYFWVAVGAKVPCLKFNSLLFKHYYNGDQISYLNKEYSIGKSIVYMTVIKHRLC